MGFFDFLKNNNKNDVPVSDYEDRAYSTGIASFYGVSSASEEEVIKIPVVQAIIEIICGTIAQLPIYLYQDNGDGNIVKLENDYRERLLNEEPNDMISAYNFKKTIVKDYLLHGSSYTYIDSYRNKINGLYNLESKNIMVKMYKKHNFKVEDADIYLYGDCGEDKFKPHELLICLKDSKDGFTSNGVLHYGKDLFNVMKEESEYIYSIYANGTLPTGVLQSASRLSRETLDRLRASWANLYQGTKNAGKTIILEEGLEYKPLSLNPKDLLYSENKAENISDVCRLFNIPESLINPNANKYGAIEQNNIFFLQYTLSPIIKSIEDSMNKSLLLEEEKEKGLFFAFDTSEVLRTTEKERYEALKVGLDAGVISVNEARWKLNLKGLKDNVMKWSLGSVLYYPETGEMKIPNMGIGIDGYDKTSNTQSTEDNQVDNNLKKDVSSDNEEELNK